MKIKFIYFDIGGVCLHWKNSLVKIHQITKISKKIIIKAFKKVDNDICLGIKKSFNLWYEIKKESNYKNNFTNNFLNFWVKNFKPITETHKLIKKLTKNNLKIGLITNIYPNALRLMIKKNKIPDIKYEQILESCRLKILKPNPLIYKIAQERAKVKPKEILFIDDKLENLIPAKKIGWNTFLFNEKNPSESIEKIKEILNIKN